MIWGKLHSDPNLGVWVVTFTFTFMHLADAFIQSDLHCIQVTVFTFDQLLLFPGKVLSAVCGLKSKVMC